MRARSLRVALFAIGVALAGSAAPAGGPENGLFEEGTAGEAPPGWFVPTEGTRVVLLDSGAVEGRLCVLMEREAGAASPFSNLMQSFDAQGLRGKRIEVTASVRCGSGIGQRVQMWVRADTAEGGMGMFDNMGDRPVTTTEWTTCTIQGDIEDNVDRINIGFMLFGEGKAWIDGVIVREIGDLTAGQVGPAPLSQQGLNNEFALGRLIGVVRHFHASDESKALDWDTYTIRAVQDIEGAKDRSELAAKLAAWVAPVAPTVQVWSGSIDAAPAPIEVPAGADVIVGYVHHGYMTPGGEGRPNIYQRSRVSEKLDKDPAARRLPAPGTTVVLDLGDGVWARVPVVVYAGPEGTLPRATAVEPSTPGRPDGWRPSGKDRPTRLAGVMHAWNVMRHFYPYWDVAACDWPTALRTALAKAAADSTAADYWITLATMHGRARDGHGFVSGPGYPDLPLRPFAWQWAGKELVVRAVAPGFDLVRPGDVIEQIDGKAVPDLYAQACVTIGGASEQFARSVALRRLGWKGGKSDVTLMIRRDDGSLTVQFPRMWRGERVEIQGLESGSEIAPGIVYFKLVGAETSELNKAMSALMAAKGVVFDMRGYPASAGTEALRHLTDDPLSSADWQVPVITMPDYQNVTFAVSNWPLMPATPRIEGQVAFLIDGSAISYAETCMGIAESYKLGEFVGEATAGTNGNVTTIKVPGGYDVMFTGMRVDKHDGSRLHGVGVVPTVPVMATPAGIAAGRDEVLEKAIEVLQRKIAAGGAASAEPVSGK